MSDLTIDTMAGTVPIAVIIPTHNRGLKLISLLERLQKCDPKPAEIWVHIDLADAALESMLHERFPSVRVLTSPIRLGPGGGRHRSLLACSTPYAVSFDDDSYPVDYDCFLHVEQMFSKHSRAAILGAKIWERQEPSTPRVESLILKPSYVGCGYAIRLAAYRQVRGYLSRPVAYGMEESDLSLQLFAAGWDIYEAGNFRVVHDTDLKHHEAPEITAGTITNVALCAFLNYPIIGWGWGLLQLTNKAAYCIRVGRLRGIWSGFLNIPGDCYRNRRYRKPIPWRTLRRYLRFCRTGVA